MFILESLINKVDRLSFCDVRAVTAAALFMGVPHSLINETALNIFHSCNLGDANVDIVIDQDWLSENDPT